MDDITTILGSDLLIQTKLNLSIQMPGDKNSILKSHIDSQSGDSVFQLVVWVPLTNAYETNSMFIHSKEFSETVLIEKE